MGKRVGKGGKGTFRLLGEKGRERKEPDKASDGAFNELEDMRTGVRP